MNRPVSVFTEQFPAPRFALDLLHQLEPAVRFEISPLDVIVHAQRETTIGVDQKYDVRLQPLGLVQVHDADDVGAARLEREGLHFVRGLAVGLECVGSGGKAPALLDNLTHAVDGVQQVACLNASGRCRGQREVAGVVENATPARRPRGRTRVQRQY